MIIRCTENLTLPECHRIKLDRPGIPGSSITLFLPLKHKWADIKPGKFYQVELKEMQDDQKF